jgi:hypothetical protein
VKSKQFLLVDTLLCSTSGALESVVDSCPFDSVMFSRQSGFKLAKAAVRTVKSDTCNRSKYTLVLVRHGESSWNKENKFTGW